MPLQIFNPPPIRTVRGSYTSAGGVFTILSGSGFTGVREGTGSCRITFTSAFSSVPTVLFSPQRADEGDVNVGSIIGNPTTSQVLLFRKTLGGTPEDGPMHFIAIQS